ncbi:MAG TPA: hypothetical protein VKF36_20820 [Syntrophorhabdales bacterium]|nr:hypothetical protein [Syntrophorhabdales bacterium]
MPDRDVTTIKDLIYYQYAKIIARRAFSVPDGTAAKGSYYGFIKQIFRELHKKLFTYSPNLPLARNKFTLHQRPLQASTERCGRETQKLKGVPKVLPRCAEAHYKASGGRP